MEHESTPLWMTLKARQRHLPSLTSLETHSKVLYGEMLRKPSTYDHKKGG